MTLTSPTSLRRAIGGTVSGLAVLVAFAAPAAAQSPLDGITSSVTSGVNEAVADPVQDVGNVVGGVVEDGTSQVGGAAQEVGGTAGDVVTDVGGTVGETVGGDLGGTVGEVTTDLGGTIKDTTGTVGETGGETGGTVGDIIRDLTGSEGDGSPQGEGGNGGQSPGSEGTGGSRPEERSSGTGGIFRDRGGREKVLESRLASSIAELQSVPSGTLALEQTAPAVSSQMGAGELVREAAEAAARFAFPLALMGLVVLFVIAQGRADRGDDKLALAPMSSDQDLLSFQ